MDKRWIAYVTVALAAALLVGGALFLPWLSGSTGWNASDVRIGLRSIEICGDDGCRSGALGALGVGDLHQVKTLGLAALIIGLACAVSLLGAAALAHFERARDWFIAPTTIAILLSGACLILGVITLVTFRGKVPAANVGTAIGFILYGLGATAGLTGAIMVGRFPHPDEDLFEPRFDAI